jgi:HemY protein
MNALPNTDTPLLNYLTAAHAAQEMGDTQSRDNYLRQAQQSMPEAEIAVELTLTQFQLANHQWEQALATLKHLQNLAPQHPHVLKLLMHLYLEVKDWYQLIALLPQLKRNKTVSDTEFQELQQNAYLQALLNLITLNSTQALEKFMSELPKNLSLNADLITPYCDYLITQGESVKAESILRRCLKKQFDENLISLYGQITPSGSQLKFAESLLKSQPHSATLLLCLGRLSKSQHLWGKARIYFEQSIELHPTPAAYMEFGNLLLQLNDHPGACSAFQKGLALSSK